MLAIAATTSLHRLGSIIRPWLAGRPGFGPLDYRFRAVVPASVIDVAHRWPR